MFWPKLPRATVAAAPQAAESGFQVFPVFNFSNFLIHFTTCTIIICKLGRK